MLETTSNLDVAPKLILNYIVHNEEGYELYDEMNNVLDRNKIIRLLHPSFFLDPVAQNIFKIIVAFYEKHKKIPNVQEITKKADFDLYDIEEDQIKLFFNEDMVQYTPDFVFTYLKAFIIRGQLNQKLVRINAKFRTENPTVDTINEHMEFAKSEFNSIVLEFTDKSRGLDLSKPTSHIQTDKTLKSTGFEYLDLVLGGWEPKTLIIFQGRPKVGKCVSPDSIITIRNKRTGRQEEITIGDFQKRMYAKKMNRRA